MKQIVLMNFLIVILAMLAIFLLIITFRTYALLDDMQSNTADALCEAAIQNDSQAINWLLKSGISVNVISRKTKRDIIMRYTPLHCASLFGSKNCVELLLRRGARPNMCDKFCETPLYCAVTNNHYELIPVLVDYKADVDMPNNWGQTPLMKSIISGYSECVAQLLKNGASVDRYNDMGDNPLIIAIKCNYVNENHMQIVKLLLRNGANPFAASKNGIIPYELAKSSSYSDIVKLFDSVKSD